MIHSYKKRRYLNQCSQRVSGIKSSATPVVKILERQVILKSVGVSNPKGLNMIPKTGQTSIDASYQVSVHLVKRFQRRIFLEIDQPETRIAYGSHVC